MLTVAEAMNMHLLMTHCVDAARVDLSYQFPLHKRLNTPVPRYRCDPEHQKVITLLCKTTLEFHGFGVEEMQSKVRIHGCVLRREAHGCFHGISLVTSSSYPLLPRASE